MVSKKLNDQKMKAMDYVFDCWNVVVN